MSQNMGDAATGSGDGQPLPDPTSDSSENDLEAGEDVPIPDDLLDEGSGSPRYSLPAELVRYKYPAVAVRGVPQSVPLASRIIVGVPTDDVGYALGAHEEAITTYESEFPLRISRLRELYQSVRLAERRKHSLLEQRELERAALNWRNDVNNRRIEQDLKNLQDDWAEARERYRKELRETQDSLRDHKEKRQPEIENARTQYWELKERCAIARDERNKELQGETDESRRKQTERKNKALDRVFEVEETIAAANQALCDRAREETKRAETLALTAEEESRAQEITAIERYAEQNEQAWQGYQALVAETVARLEAEERVLRQTAHETEAELLAERRERESCLHDVEQAVAEERVRRGDDHHEARQAAAGAAARAGLSPGEGASNFRRILQDRITEDVVADETSTGHLEPHRIHPFVKVLLGISKVFLYVALGGIFGLSLGILVGSVDLTSDGRKELGIWTVVGYSLIGLFVYQLMGTLAHRSAAYASEEFHAESTQQKPTLRALAAGFATMIVVIGMIALEAYVERYGIVQTILDQQREMGNTRGLPLDKALAY